MSKILKTDNAYRIAIAVTALLLALIAGLVLRHSLSTRSKDLAQAATLNSETDQVNQLVSVGRSVSKHQGAALNRANRYNVKIPTAIDDRSILASVVRAASRTGAILSNETRGNPTSTTGTTSVPVGLTLNGPNQASVVSFPGILQQQNRLFTVTGLVFDFVNGNQVQVTSSAYVDSGSTPPARVGGSQ